MRCRHCQAFLEELRSTPYVPDFQLICVDPTAAGRPSLPPWLKSVPTLLVAGESTPKVGPGPVNNWLFERKMSGGGGPKATVAATDMERRAPLAPPIYKPDVEPRPAATARGGGGGTPVPSAAGGGGPEPDAYHGSEMSGGKWSDTYSFLEDTEFKNFSSEKGYNRIGRNFESLIGGGAPAGGGAGGGAAAGPKRSAKEEAQLKEYEAFMAARNGDIPMPRARQ